MRFRGHMSEAAPPSTAAGAEAPTNNRRGTPQPAPPPPPEESTCGAVRLRCLGSWQSSVSNCFTTVMDALPYALSHYFFPVVPEHQQRVFQQLSDEYVCDFTSERVGLLARLWNGHWQAIGSRVSPFNEMQHRKHEGWKDMGFQGVDPTTDLRGAGVLGLEQLVYFVEKYPQDWTELLTPNFLVGAVGVNLTMWLLTLLHIQHGTNVLMAQLAPIYSSACARASLASLIYSPDVGIVLERLNDVFCTAMLFVHKRWMQSPQNIMEFNNVLKSSYLELDHVLARSTSLDNFRLFAAAA